MKRTWLAGPVTIVAVLAISLFTPWPSLASTAVTLSPSSYVSLDGADGGQDVAALAGSIQTGTSVDPANALSLLTPGKAKYRGYRVFNLPAEVSPATITSIQAQVNYFGPGKRHQTWTWTIYNWTRKTWVKLGNSKLAVENNWSPLTLNLKARAGILWQFVGPVDGEMLVMVRSNNNKYDAALDYESLVVTTSADVTITPPAPWTPPAAHSIWHPTPGTTWQWQLTEPVDTSYDVQMYDVDLFDTPVETIQALHADGRTVICYFSPGSFEKWRPDARAFPKIVIGKRYVGWPGEWWLDVRQIGVLAPIMRARLDLAVAKGCDGVEPDNIDAFQQKTGFPLSYQDQLNYNLWLANEAHARYLSIGVKNDLDQLDVLVDNFDWTLNEQCYQYDPVDCDKLKVFIDHGKAVFGTEYVTNPAVFCPPANAAGYSFMKKRWDLDAWVIPCW